MKQVKISLKQNRIQNFSQTKSDPKFLSNKIGSKISLKQNRIQNFSETKSDVKFLGRKIPRT